MLRRGLLVRAAAAPGGVVSLMDSSAPSTCSPFTGYCLQSELGAVLHWISIIRIVHERGAIIVAQTAIGWHFEAILTMKQAFWPTSPSRTQDDLLLSGTNKGAVVLCVFV